MNTEKKLAIAVLLTLHTSWTLRAQTKVTVVNIIPNAASGEQYQDSEPTLAVQPNGMNMAAAAITNGPAVQGYAPIYVSINGGQEWTRLDVVPIGNGTTYPFVDPSLSFSGANGLYVALLESTTGEVSTFPSNVLRKINFADATEKFAPFGNASRLGVDQPHIRSTHDSASNKDVIFVGSNDDTIDKFGRTATVDQYLDPPGVFERTRVEARKTATRNGAPIRIAIHPTQRTYAAFFARRGIFAPCLGRYRTDLVVVRDDSTGTGPRSFPVLTSPATPLVPPETPLDQRGKMIVSGIHLPRTRLLGLDRVGYDLAIAVGPSPDLVYVAWAEVQGPCPAPGTYKLRVFRSTNGGMNWQPAPGFAEKINAKNPSLAINSAGTVALLYQRLTGTRWETTVERVNSDGSVPDPIVLANTNALQPARQYQPYLGDYTQMTAIGTTFYGIFSASNDFVKANFPSGVHYNRRAECVPAQANNDCASKTLKDTDGVRVEPSIDPFFFKIEP